MSSSLSLSSSFSQEFEAQFEFEFEFEFLTGVRIRTSVDLVTGSSPNICSGSSGR